MGSTWPDVVPNPVCLWIIGADCFQKVMIQPFLHVAALIYTILHHIC
jgi:hypothetical protein